MRDRRIVSLSCATVLEAGARGKVVPGGDAYAVAAAGGREDSSIGEAVGAPDGVANALVRLDVDWVERRAVARFPGGTELAESAGAVAPRQGGNRGPAALFALAPGPGDRLMVVVGRPGVA